MNKWILLLCLTVIYVTTNAQLTEKPLDEVTVTASARQAKIAGSGRNVLVVKGSFFNSLPVNSVDELLKYIPGVEVQMRGPMGAQSDIVIRGGTFQQVLVLLDGVRLNDANTGHFNSYIPVSAAEIERVEILKGASSAIYGSEAVGGVIHIITKTFAAKKTEKEMQVQAAITAGEYGMYSINAGGYTTTEKWQLSAGYLSNYANGPQLRGTKGFVDNKTATLAVKRLLKNNWEAGLRGAFDKRDFNAQNFYTSFLSDTASEKVTTNWLQALVKKNGTNYRLSISSAFKKVTDHYAYNSVAAANHNESYLSQVQAVYELNTTDKQSWVTGVQYFNRRIVSNDRGNHNINHIGAFVNFSQQLGNGLTLHPALRFDYSESLGANLIPQINISYKIKNIQLRASAGTTIRDADFTERYNNYNKALVTGGSIGNPALKAETSFSYEAGADFFANNGIKISAGVFRRQQRNMVDWVSTPYANMPRKDNLKPDVSYALATNMASVNTAGAEADVQWQKNWSSGVQLLAGVGAVVLSSKNSANEQPGFYLSSHAKALVNFYTNWQYKNFDLSLTGIYKKRNAQKAAAINAETTPEYFLINTRLGYTLGKKTTSALIFIQVNNVGDIHYSDLLGSIMPGRWLMGGVQLSIK